MDIRDQKIVDSTNKKELAMALQEQIAKDKHRHEYREIDLVPKEMATSGDIMFQLSEMEQAQFKN